MMLFSTIPSLWIWSEWGKNFYWGKDAITINWDNDIFSYVSDTFYAIDVYKSNINDNWSIFKEYYTLAASQQGGIGHWTDLKAFKKYVGGEMLFLLNTTAPIFTGTSHNTTININYAHEPIPLTGLSLSVLEVGVGLSWNIECNTMADTVDISFSR